MGATTNSLFFLALIFLSWAALAAYVGLTAFLMTQPWRARWIFFLFTAAVILVPTGFFLDDQSAVPRLNDLWILTGEKTHVFWFGKFLLNACFFSGMAVSLLSGGIFLPGFAGPSESSACGDWPRRSSGP